jgi:hypothetical protein
VQIKKKYNEKIKSIHPTTPATRKTVALKRQKKTIIHYILKMGCYHYSVAKSKNNIIFCINKKWWIYCCYFLCLINNQYSIQVDAGYSEADDLINELDRPSKWIFFFFFEMDK